MPDGITKMICRSRRRARWDGWACLAGQHWARTAKDLSCKGSARRHTGGPTPWLIVTRNGVYCETSSRASRWTNADKTAGSASDTASQSMLAPLACATLNPRTVRSSGSGVGARDASGRTKTSIVCCW